MEGPTCQEYIILVWEPSFALKHCFLYKSQPIQLRTSPGFPNQNKQTGKQRLQLWYIDVYI